MIAALVSGIAGASPAASAATPPCETSTCVHVRGQVRRAGDRVPVEGAAVIAAAPGEPPAWTTRAETGNDGSFEVDVPLGTIRLVVLVPGFERFDATFQARDDAEALVIVVRPDSTEPYRTVVAAPRRPDAGVSPRRLDREEVATAPGTQGDTLRALQSLPGVARTPGGLGLLVLRGASPDQSVLFVGEHRVPRAFHALAISSVVPADALEEVEFVPSNFASRYGNGSGGAVVLRPRSGRRDGWHGYGEIDLAGVGGLVEGPIRRGSMLAAVQRSYVDAYLSVAEQIGLPPCPARNPRRFTRGLGTDYALTSGASGAPGAGRIVVPACLPPSCPRSRRRTSASGGRAHRRGRRVSRTQQREPVAAPSGAGCIARRSRRRGGRSSTTPRRRVVRPRATPTRSVCIRSASPAR